MPKSESVSDFLARKAKESIETFDLPSGLKCRMTFFSAKKAMMAQKIAQSGQGGNASINEDLLYGAMIAESCEFSVNGKNWEKMIGEDIPNKLPGMDFMHLQGKLGGVSLEEEK